MCVHSCCHTPPPIPKAACLLCSSCCPHREELATLNRSVQARAKDIKQHLESLSVARSELPEPAQAKLRKLLQDFAATLQDYKAAQRVAADKEARFLPRAPAAAAVATTATAAAASNAAAAGSSGAEADIESQALLQEQALAERRALDSTVAFQEALIEERDQGIAGAACVREQQAAAGRHIYVPGMTACSLGFKRSAPGG